MLCKTENVSPVLHVMLHVSSFYRYYIQPNYHTVCLGFSKLLRKLVVKYVSTYLKYAIKIRSANDLSSGAYAMFWHLCVCVCVCFSDFLYESICYGYSFEFHQQVDAIQMGTHNICIYEEVDKKVHWL